MKKYINKNINQWLYSASHYHWRILVDLLSKCIYKGCWQEVFGTMVYVECLSLSLDLEDCAIACEG